MQHTHFLHVCINANIFQQGHIVRYDRVNIMRNRTPLKLPKKVLRNGSHSHTLWKGDINLVESGESAYSDTNEATAQTSWSSAPLNKAQRRIRVEYHVIVEAE